MMTNEAQAIMEISQMNDAYANFADQGCYEEYASLFTSDGVLNIGSRDFKGPDAIKAVLIAGAAKRRAREPGNFQRHHITTRHITLTDAENARGKIYIMVVTELGIDQFALYDDRYVRENGGWRFAYRKATLDWIRPDSRFLLSLADKN